MDQLRSIFVLPFIQIYNHSSNNSDFSCIYIDFLVPFCIFINEGRKVITKTTKLKQQ